MTDSSARRLAILGGGVMGETLLTTVLAAGVAQSDVVVAEKNAARADELSATHGVEVTDLTSAVRGAATVFVVVKPQDVAAVLPEGHRALIHP